MGFFKNSINTVRNSRSIKIFLCIVFFSLTLGIVAFVLRDKIIPVLNDFSKWVSSQGFVGGLLYALLLTVTCFPPIIGYSLLLTLSGYIWGVGWGFLINYIGALTGGTLCFIIARMFFKRDKSIHYKDYELESPNDHDLEMMSRSRASECDAVSSDNASAASTANETAVSSTKSDTPFKRESLPSEDGHERLLFLITRYLDAHPARTYGLLIVLRLAPYPYNILNTLLARISCITIWQFILVTAISLSKLVLHAWLGSTLSQLEEIFANPVQKFRGADNGGGTLSSGQIAQIIILSMALIFGVSGGYYLYRVIQNALDEVDPDRHAKKPVKIVENTGDGSSSVEEN